MENVQRWNRNTTEHPKRDLQGLPVDHWDQRRLVQLSRIFLCGFDVSNVVFRKNNKNSDRVLSPPFDEWCSFEPKTAVQVVDVLDVAPKKVAGKPSWKLPDEFWESTGETSVNPFAEFCPRCLLRTSPKIMKLSEIFLQLRWSPRP